MQFWQGLILGFILGWIIEWIIDWWYWRGGSGGSALSTSYGNDLTRITGINSDYAGRLNSSGVPSVAALASSTPSVVRSAIGGDEGKTIDAEAWIVEAGGLSGKSSGASTAASLTSGTGSAKPSTSGASGAASLTGGSGSAGGSAKPSSGTTGSSKPASTGTGATSGVGSTKPASGTGSAKPSSGSGATGSGATGSSATGSSKPVSTGASASGTGSAKPSSGATGGSKPASTGTSATSSAASTKPASSSAPSGSASGSRPAATASAGASGSTGGSASGTGDAPRRDNLTKIHGVGKVFQGKFYDAGYTTWESVSKLDDAEIRRVIQPKDWQKIETDVWIEEARILAGGGTTTRASGSGGSSGDGDDLTKIHGVGKVYQGKFHDADIYLWSEVAELSDEKILAIIEPAEWQKIEPEEWKAEARQFAKEKGGDA